MASTRRCACPGHWVNRRLNWVVTQRGFALVEGQVPSGYCELKCRICQGKWRTKAAYTRSLPDWVERKYKPLPYAEILLLIQEGRLRADFTAGLVFKERRVGRRWTGRFKQLQSRTQRGNNGTSLAAVSRHLYVLIVDAGRRREISLGRLIWMIYHCRVIPAGYDVDHGDGDPANNAITNLRVAESSVNRGSSSHDAAWEKVPF